MADPTQSIFPADSGCTHNGTDGPQVDFNNLLNKPVIEMATPFDITSAFIDFINWNSIDGWTQGSTGTTSITPLGSQILFSVGNGGTAWLYQKAPYNFLFTTGKAVTFDIPVFYPGVAGSVNQYIYILLVDTAFSSLTATPHVGFKFNTYGTVANLSGTTSDGSGESTVPGATYGILSSILSLKLVFIPGTSCTFYVNGISIGSITTHLPSTSAEPLVYFGLSCPSAQNFNFGRILLSKQY